MAIVPNHFPEVLAQLPPDPYDVAEPANRDPSVPAGEPNPDWPDSDPRWDERWGLTFEDAIPQLDLRDFVVTAADLKALGAVSVQTALPPSDQTDVLLVPDDEGRAS
jgi:hypothetical protein